MHKSKKAPDLTRGGKSNDIAHFSFILVFTVPGTEQKWGRLGFAYYGVYINLRLSLCDCSDS